MRFTCARFTRLHYSYFSDDTNGFLLTSYFRCFGATAVSFAVSAVILKADAKEESDEFAQKVKETQAAKAIKRINCHKW